MIKDYYFFKEQINRTIQNSGLDIGMIYYIFKDIYTNIENTYYAQINKELIEENETEKIMQDESLNKPVCEDESIIEPV